MKFMLLLIPLLLISFVYAETTFFDQDDLFIMSKIVSTADNGDGCRYEWNCTNWSECFSSGWQIRNCTNIGSCSDTNNPPEIEQNCTYLQNIQKIEEKNNESENVIEKQNETEIISEKQKTTGKLNYLFIAIAIVAILALVWIYYFWKKRRAFLGY